MMERLHPLTLSFRDPEAERAFAAHSLARLRLQGRAAILVGTFLYLLYGVLDAWLVPIEYQKTMWVIRLLVLTVPFAVFLLAFHPASGVSLMQLRSEQTGMDQILTYSKQWYVNHTSKADHRFADFLARGPSGMAGQDASAPARSHPASPAIQIWFRCLLSGSKP